MRTRASLSNGVITDLVNAGARVPSKGVLARLLECFMQVSCIWVSEKSIAPGIPLNGGNGSP